MSVAYYIVLDVEEPGFDAFVNGKFLARDAEKLDAICDQLDIPKIDDFVFMSEDELADLLDDDIELPEGEGEGEQWFTADEGIAFVTALTEHIKANPETLSNPQGVLEDLAEYADVFGKAKGIDAKWRLNLDI
ncbi:MAG: hypothetical protein HC889_17410 [Synechococcaceae cyanobacterium SM1_2_3]|nr:hypothetical protein [Synechococcaceae cyanobacterium SM1_2_3]